MSLEYYQILNHLKLESENIYFFYLISFKRRYIIYYTIKSQYLIKFFCTKNAT